MEEEIVVSLHKGVSKEEILDILSRDTTNDSSVDSSIVPDRPVSIENERNSSNRVFHAILTAEEALKLKTDPRIMGINKVPTWDNNWLHTLDYGRKSADPIPGNPAFNTPKWNRDGTGTGTNWGLFRIANINNPWYSVSSDYFQGADIDANISYTVDGTGVDYINQEGHLPAIPSSNSYFSVSTPSFNRYHQFQWNTLPNCSSMPTIEYTNSAWWSQHATIVTAIATGKYQGVARNANVYALPINFINSSFWFDAIKEFHRAKPVDPVTGIKRPTVVNASWGTTWTSKYGFLGTVYDSIQRLNFRGSTVTGSTAEDFVNVTTYALNNFINYDHVGDLYPSMRAEVEEMIDEGVIYITSAGNTGSLIDRPTGLDWNNTVTLKSQTYHPNPAISGDTFYYCRGSSNTGNGSIEVGGISYYLHPDLPYANNKEVVASFSCKGPGVPIYAPAWAGIWTWDESANSEFSVDDYGAGTSYAAPLVSGTVCQLLQLSPQMTSPRVKEWLVNNGKTDILFDNNKNEANTTIRFGDMWSLWSSNNVVAYNPFWIVQDQDISTSLYNVSNNVVDISA